MLWEIHNIVQIKSMNLKYLSMIVLVTHSQVPGWTHLRVHLYGIGTRKGAPDFQHYRGVEGRARSPEIRLGRGTSRSSLNLHPKQTTKWLVHIREHLWVLGQATGTLNHKTHHGPDLGEATTFPHIVFSAPRFGDYIQMALFPGTPKLESRNCPETENLLVNFGSRSDIMSFGRPWCLKMWEKNNLPVSWAMASSFVGIDALLSHRVKPTWGFHKVK
jgi:hypothetical protein